MDLKHKTLSISLSPTLISSLKKRAKELTIEEDRTVTVSEVVIKALKLYGLKGNSESENYLKKIRKSK